MRTTVFSLYNCSLNFDPNFLIFPPARSLLSHRPVSRFFCSRPFGRLEGRGKNSSEVSTGPIKKSRRKLITNKFRWGKIYIGRFCFRIQCTDVATIDWRQKTVTMVRVILRPRTSGIVADILRKITPCVSVFVCIVVSI